MRTDRKFYQSTAIVALATGLLLLIPLIAMQFSHEVVWTPFDFICAGTLIFITGLAYILITRKSGKAAYRCAVGFALLSGLFLLWANGAVGIIGSENNEINLMYFGVIAVGIVGAFLARFQPKGMMITLLSMAFAQAIIAVVAIIVGMAEVPGSSLMEIITVNGFFIMLFAISAGLFWFAGQERPAVGSGTTQSTGIYN